MLEVIEIDGVCASLEQAFEKQATLDFRKQTVNRTTQLLKWLIDASPSVVGWKTTTSVKLAELDAAFETTVVKMIDGEFWKRQLVGWKDVAAALLALLALVRDNTLLETTRYIVDRCKAENDQLHKRMHDRELRNERGVGETPPALGDIERRDVAAEAKWTTTLRFLEDADLEPMLRSMIKELQLCVTSGDPPRGVLKLLGQLPKPPGFKTLAERREEERLVRAKEVAEDEEF